VTLKIGLMALLVIGTPWVMHMGAIGGDKWTPAPRGMLRGSLGRNLIRFMNLVLLTNGVLFAAAYILWALRDGFEFLIPLALSVPTLVAQTMLAGASAAQSNR
jgi:hypothetical protein